jgi:hypothetical protein
MKFNADVWYFVDLAFILLNAQGLHAVFKILYENARVCSSVTALN